MPTVTRTSFVEELSGKTIDKAEAQADPRLAGMELGKADLDGDGQIKGATEARALFKELDRFDKNGVSSSVSTSYVGTKLTALREHAKPISATVPGDPALASAFPTGIPAGVSFGASAGKTRLVALQYALGRLELYAGLADGLWGAKTRGAIEAIQAQKGLPVTGAVDAATLDAIDLAVRSRDLRVPAAKAADPLAHLSTFTGLTTIDLSSEAGPFSWKHPAIREAYGTFVGEYWQVMKDNRVEGDCKTIALFFMDQFRKKLKADTGVELPRSKSSRGSIAPSTWTCATAAKPMGFFQRTLELPIVRPGYAAASAIEALDPSHSLLYGVNVRYAGSNANAVSRATEIVATDEGLDNGGDRTLAELPLDEIRAGDLIFIDHTGDGSYDHTVNVVKAERDADGTLRKLVLAVGSFDDMQDADASTPPAGLHTVNNYSEEVTVRFSSLGRITGSEVTWSSEPVYVSPRRYAAHNTLMELRPGGTMFLGRWT